jgi:hypothetical protein
MMTETYPSDNVEERTGQSLVMDVHPVANVQIQDRVA